MRSSHPKYDGERGAILENEALGCQDYDRINVYWQSALADCKAPPFPPLPSSVQQPAANTTIKFQCPPLPRIILDTTLSTLVRAGWAIVTSRYVSTQDVIFGATVNTGTGLPISIVPVRVQVAGGQTVPVYLKVLQQQATEMIPYEQTGLQRIAEIGDGPRHACGFQTLLVVQSIDGIVQSEALGKWHESLGVQGSTTYGLVLQCTLAADGIKIVASFDSRMVEPWLLQKILEHFSFVMQQLARADLKTKVADIDTLTMEDRHELWAWNHEMPPAAVDRCVHDLFAEHARARPNAPAICAWDGDMTYAELDKLSTRLACHLVSLGVGLESVVPLCFEKSMWTVVAMLAVLKSGGAFVPLDPEHPESRHKEIFKQTAAEVVLASAQNSTRWADSAHSVVVVSKTLTNQLVSKTDEIYPTANPSNAAYVIFTSGSTGIPKGVVLEHRAVSTSCLGHGKAFGFTPYTRVLQFASYTFDACITEIITTLVHGGCVCVPSESDRSNDLAKAINTMEVNWVLLTSSVARMLDPDTVPSLQVLVFGGEQVNSADCERWAGYAKVVNAYGPTECCVLCTAYFGIQGFKSGMIGKAVASVSWVVDPENHNRLAPLGTIGELLVEGPILARSYLHDPEKTKAAFINDPAWLLKGGGGYAGRRGRMYKTGDLVRYGPDGSMICIGRKDDQVKVRGRRVELGEVEHHIRQCVSKVKQVAVELILPGGAKQSAMLAAFFQLDDEARNSLLVGKAAESDLPVQVVFPAEVNENLAERLPEYMVPTVSFLLLRLPMMASGKTDRKRLREIGASFSAQQLAEMRTSSQGPKRPPSTKTEKIMQQLWAQVLNIKLESIGLDDSFFRLGGDSIMAMKLVSEARKTGIQLAVADIFRQPKLENLGRLARVSVNNTAEEILPFTLLGKDVDAENVAEEVAASYSIHRALIEDIYPCTPLQEGLISLTSKRSSDYIMQSVLKLSSALQLDAFRAAWEETVRSTAILRTRIVQHCQLGMLQVVLQEGIQWAQADELESYLQRDKEASMEIGQPLARYALVTGGSGQPSWFVWTVHHALYDGASLPLVMNVINDAYQRVPIERREFKAFVKYLVEKNSNDIEEYWQSALADTRFTPFPPLPLYARELVADMTIKQQCPLPSTRESDITASTLVRAAWAIIASRHTGLADVVFGITVSGRNAPLAGVESMVGPTIATVPVRVQVAGEQTVSTYLERLQHQMTEMIPYEQAGLQQISKMGADARHACGFQTLLVIQPQEIDLGVDPALGTWEVRSDAQDLATFALTLQCFLTGEDVKVVASFDSRAVEPWKMKKMLGQFSFVMTQLTGPGTEKTVADIDLLTPEDKDELWQWNQAAPEAVDKCIHELIRDQSLDQPSSPAVCAWDGELVYSELDELSTRLAHHLFELGIVPEAVVPLCFEKSMWTVVAILAVLKAGAAFLLLDPSHPIDRLGMLCRKVSATIAIASPASQSKIDCFVRTTVILNEETTHQLPRSAQSLQTKVAPTNTAYVIFTSGSTGEPKGCVIEHQSYCSAALGHGQALGMQSSTRSLQFGSYSFAGSIYEMIVTLIHGGCVCIPSEEDRRSNLAQAIDKMDINWAFLTSTVLSSIEPDSVRSLTHLCVGGEPIWPSQIAQWADRVQLRQSYGSAETSGIVSSSQLGQGSTTMDVGKAATGRYWIVDLMDSDRLAALGAIGELVLEGTVVGRSYIGDVQKTSAAFIEEPPWRKLLGQCTAGSKFYKSGDLAAYTSNGAIKLIGRKDTQVKVRGQRIELGEIEHQARLSSPDLSDVAVELVACLDGSKREPILMGFVVVSGKTGSYGKDDERERRTRAVLETIQDRLEKFLPQYMVPFVIIPLEELPTTSSRKTDRKRLREIGASFSAQQLTDMRTSSQGQKRQPSTETERMLQQQLAQVLKIKPESIGLDDNFFRLGGDSIIAMQLVAKARKAGIQLTVADVFQHPRLVDLAGLDNSHSNSIAEEILAFSLLGEDADATQVCEEVAVSCSVDASVVEDIYPCSPLQEGLMSLTSKKAGNYIMQNVLELRADIDSDAFRAAWEQVVQSAAALRTRIVQDNKLGLLQAVMAQDICWIEAEGLDEYLEQDKSASMELGEPLTRYALVKGRHGVKTWFVWTIHHALYDGWSLPRIIDAVNNVYKGGVLKKQPDFHAFISYLGQQNKESAVAYWQGFLADCQATPFPPLPSTVQYAVADTTVEYQCQPLSRGPSNTTTSTLLRGAWAIIAGRYTNSDDVVFGTTVTGRNAPVAGIEAIMGPTIATVPVRVRVADDWTISAFLEVLQQQATEMILYEQTGLQQIAKMGPDARHACGFQTLLVVQHGDDVLKSDEVLGKWQSCSELRDFTTYGLVLQFTLAIEGVQITASFDSRAIDRWLVEKILGQFSFIMQQLAEADAEAKVADIKTLTPEDRQELWEWNREMPPAVNQCIHDLFVEQAGARPNAPVICAWDGNMTYGELDKLSTRLAGHLVGLGVQPEDIVPLCFEKSMWTVVSMLAVLKAGGAFLLLDPSLPIERLALMCRRVSSTLALASQACIPLVEGLIEAFVVVNRDLLFQLPQRASLSATVRPSNTAYVIFTSGSTGEPKGCRIEHRSSCSAVVGHGRSVGMHTSTRTLQFGSYSFAGSLAETLMTLLHGGCLCIPSEEERITGLASAISRMTTNWAFLTSTVLDLISPQSVPSLTTICVGGEPMRASQIAQWKDQVHLRQTYGSSETSGFVSSIRLMSTSSTRDVGKASTGRYWIVEPNSSKISPIGAVGEVLIEGHVLGREYIDEPDKTAETFIEAPSWRALFKQGKEKPRLYKTGDLARYKMDGSIELLGRKDSQVKLRGQRIELGEIEHQAWLAKADVKELAVELIKPHEDGESMLACFVALNNSVDDQTNGNSEDTVPQTRTQIAVQAIQERLEQFLPQYMVPAVFIPVAQLPTTTSRKVDRRQLREIGKSLSTQQLASMRILSQGQKRPPSTETERTLQQLWAHVLHIEPKSIGLDDSFFWLGGDSITAMKLVGEARKTGIQLTVADVFRQPKLALLSGLAQAAANINAEPIPPFSLLSPTTKEAIFSTAKPFQDIQLENIVDVLPVSCIQEYLLDQGIQSPQAIFSDFFVNIGPLLDVQLLEDSCRAVVNHFPILRTKFVSFQEKLWQVVLRDIELPFHTFNVNGPLPEESYALCVRDTEKSSPLGLLTSFMLLRNSSKENRLVIRLSHAQYDGVCLPIILASLVDAYLQKPLQPAPSFSNYLAYVSSRQAISGRYWRELLKGSHITSIIPKLRPKNLKDVDLRKIQAECFISKPQLSKNITIASLVSSAWAVVLSNIAGKEDVVYGSVVSGRNSNIPGISEMVGPCLNIIPIRACASSTSTSAELLHSIQDQYISLGESDSMGMKDIVQQCTDWPAESAFDSVVQHQNIVEYPELHFAGSDTKLEWSDASMIVPYISVMSFPRGDKLKLRISGNTHTLTPKFADTLLAMLRKAIVELSTDLQTSLAQCKSSLPAGTWNDG